MQNTQSGTFSGAVGSDETENLTRTRKWRTVKLEAVWTVTVGRFTTQVGRQINDLNGLKGTFTDANTSSDAKGLTDLSNG